MEQVIVFRPGALGDTLLTVPALRSLRRALSAARIELVGHGEAAGLLRAAGLVDSATPFDNAEVTSLFLDPPRVPERWQGARLVVLWMAKADPIARTFEEAGARQVVARSPESASVWIHTADHLGATLAEVGVTLSPADSLLPLRIEGEPTEVIERRLVVHPGSGATRKNWPAENFGELIALLDHESWHTVVAEGPADAQAVQMLCQSVDVNMMKVVRSPSLTALAELLGGASLYVGNDSGVSHLAGLLGVPTIAIFGETDPRQWAPRGLRVRIAGEMNRWPSVEEVGRTATDWLE